MRYYSENQRVFIETLLNKIRSHYGDQLTSLAVFGSFAREENRLNSDLDLLIILEDSNAKGRLELQDDFVRQVEMPLDGLRRDLETEGIHTEISNIFLKRPQAAHFNPLYLDMTEHSVLVFDADSFLENTLAKVRQKMLQWGSVRKPIGGHWYWEIKPGLRWGERINYDQ